MTTLPDGRQDKKAEPVQLGNCFVSLSFEDIHASKAFCEKLDFEQVSLPWIVLALRDGELAWAIHGALRPRAVVDAADAVSFPSGWAALYCGRTSAGSSAVWSVRQRRSSTREAKP